MEDIAVRTAKLTLSLRPSPSLEDPVPSRGNTRRHPATLPAAVSVRGRLIAALVSATMVTAGCGSTVPVQQQAAAPGVAATAVPLDDGMGFAGPGGASGAAGGTDVADGSGLSGSGGVASAAGGGVGGQPAGAPAPGQPAGGSAPGSSASTSHSRVGPGVTEDKVFIGLVKVRNAGSANESIGADVSAGDPNLQQKAMIREINRTGGLAGRELVPVWAELDENTTQTQAQIEQQLCETWTQDNEVFAGFSSLASDLLKTCMERAGAVLFGNNLSISDARTFQQFPHYYEIAGMRLDRIARVYPSALAADGYFDRDAVVGVVTYDQPAYKRATDTVLVPELRGLGIGKVEVQYVPWGQTMSELGGSSTGISNAVLRFRQEGVTHVMFFEAGAVLAFLWFPQAESQGYRPRYGLNSQSAPATHTAENEQLRNALAVGWIPFIDVGDSRHTQLPPAFPACLKIMRRAGAQYDSQNPNAKRVSGATCDAFWLLQQGLKAAGADLTADGFVRGVASIGGRFASAHSYNADLSSRRDGASIIRPLAYRNACECWRYSGPARRVD